MKPFLLFRAQLFPLCKNEAKKLWVKTKILLNTKAHNVFAPVQMEGKLANRIVSM